MDIIQNTPTQAPSLNAIVSSVKKLTTKATPIPPRKNPGVGTAQWELLASPGHVLFEQVSILFKLAKKYGVVMAVSICIGLMSFVLPMYAGDAVTKVTNTVAGWFGHAFDKKSELPVVARSPYVANIVPLLPGRISAELFGKLMTAQDFGGAGVLGATIAKVQAGAPVDCEQSTKVTDDWVTEANEVPRCRYSADKTRLWVWAVIKNGSQFEPIFGVVRKGTDGKAAYYNVAVRGAQPLEGKSTINPQFVPRALAADLTELNQVAVATITPRMPAGGITSTLFGKLMGIQDFTGAAFLGTVVANVQDGKPVNCDQTSKVTGDWISEASANPRCRYSPDKSRLWVFGVINDGTGFAPILGVVHKDDAGKFTYYNVAAPGVKPIAGKETINPQLVPAALATDFAELNQGAAQ